MTMTLPSSPNNKEDKFKNSDDTIIEASTKPIFSKFLQTSNDLMESPKEKKLHSLRYIYNYSCQEHNVHPNEHVLRQLSPVVGGEWPIKVKILNFENTYLGREGCAALIPVIAFCPALTHLLMPSIGLTSEVARPLFNILQNHSSLIWLDVSGNHLNDDVGRWILNMLLENNNIRFVILRNTSISPPLLRKIESHLAQRIGLNPSGIRTAFTETLDLGNLTPSEQSSFSASMKTCDGSRTRRIPASVATGLAELRHRLYRNRHSIQDVYDCFILPRHVLDDNNNNNNNNNKDDVEALVDVMKINGEWDVVSISTMITGQCSWRAFFRGLRLLGIHAVSRSLTESVTFATICGICNFETINFGKLLSFLRPHVAMKTTDNLKQLGESRQFSFTSTPAISSPSISSSHEYGVSPTHRQFKKSINNNNNTNSNSSTSAPTLLNSSSSLPSMGGGGVGVGKRKKNISFNITSSKPPNTEIASLILKPQESIIIGSQTSRPHSSSRSPAISFSELHSVLTPLSSGGLSLEGRFKLELCLNSRKLQYVVDRLYDTRKTLQESFQPCDEMNSDSPYLVRLDEVVERAVVVVGENYREEIISLLEPWKVNIKGDFVFVDTEGWLDSMYIPDLQESSNNNKTPPFPLSEEKRMWRTVDVEMLRYSINLW